MAHDAAFDVGSTILPEAPLETPLADAESTGTGPVSNLAALLDQFTANITNPDAHTVGSFAETIEALHSELALLARHFGAGHAALSGAHEAAHCDDHMFADAFADTAADATDDGTTGPGIAAAEELEHLCRQFSG